MKNGVYSNRIYEMIKSFPVGEPFTNRVVSESLRKDFDITKDNAERVTNNQLKRMYDAGKIGRIEKGVYYVPKQTIFGQTKPDYNSYAVNILTKSKDDVIGYECGASFFNRIGLSTLVPQKIEVATNHYRKKLPKSCHITIRKPRDVVTGENFQYLQILDAIHDLNKFHIDSENPNGVLKAVVAKNKLNEKKLMELAKNRYPRRVLIDVVEIITGGDTK
ncbi:MAG: DUF6088 family protein [Bacteroides sp.]|nr:DUF6088 family protein [Eubacterium sp.]MCM1419643.1 DUF6088 family protein [Roseburia sp.]MCM1463603.1 DUF6088 family protein [Bacteroides sp.]